jgi:hypothetical protein
MTDAEISTCKAASEAEMMRNGANKPFGVHVAAESLLREGHARLFS